MKIKTRLIFNSITFKKTLFIFSAIILLNSCGKKKDKLDSIEITLKTSPSNYGELDLSEAQIILYDPSLVEIYKSKVSLLDNGYYGIKYEPGVKLNPGYYSYEAYVGDSISSYFDPTYSASSQELTYLDFNDKTTDELQATGYLAQSYWPRFRGSTWIINSAFLNGIEAESLAPCFTDDKIIFTDFQYTASWDHGAEICDPSDEALTGMGLGGSNIIFTENTFQDQPAMKIDIWGVIYVDGLKTNVESIYIIDPTTISISGFSDAGDTIDYIMTKQ